MRALPIILFLILAVSSFAMQVNPTSFTEHIQPGESKAFTLTIENDLNSTLNVSIVSSDESIVVPATDKITLSPLESRDLVITISSPAVGTYQSELIIIGEETVRVPITVISTGEEMLEPTFSKLILTVEPDTMQSRTISFRNKYSDRVEVKDIEVLGSIITKEGMKPLRIKGAELGWLDPGKDLTVEIDIDTVRLDYPKTYNCKLTVVYYYKSERKESSIDFQINVQKGLTTVTKSMRLVLSPAEPSPGEKLSAILLDESNSTIAGKIFVTVYDLSGNEISKFQMIEPFVLETGKKYCLKGEAEYYETVEKCIVPRSKYIRIKTSLENPRPNETIVIQVVDSDGNPITNAKLTIDGREYNSPQVTVMMDEGTHLITASAPGYEPISRSIIVLPPVEIVNVTGKLTTGSFLSVLLNRDAYWEVWFGDNPLFNGTSSNITFKPMKEGTYTIYSEDLIKDIEIKKSGFFQLPSFEMLRRIPSWVFIAIIAVVLIVFLAKGRRKKAKHITLVGMKGPAKPIETKSE